MSQQRTIKTGKIYCIKSNQTDKMYIGSTFMKLSKRFNLHKHNNGKKGIGCSSSEILKYDDCYIELIEEHYDLIKKQLERIEGELIRKNINNCVNKMIAGRTKDEWWQDNKEKIYKIRKMKNECVCGGNYTNGHKSDHIKTIKHIRYIENAI